MILNNGEIKRFTIGRKDFSLTVYVPWNCNNNCKFCTSKQEYELINCNFNKVVEQLKKVRNSTISTIVFTGGEPLYNIKLLDKLISIVDNKTIYINTTFPNTEKQEAIDFVNNTKCIQGINISRHYSSYEKDTKILKDIITDELIENINKNIRINMVMNNNNSYIQEIDKIIRRWEKVNHNRCNKNKKYIEMCINLRENYNFQDLADLHELSKNYLIKDLSNKYTYINHSMCNVCDTVQFGDIYLNNPFFINYHRGTAITSCPIGDEILEINDLILFQDGFLAYDWDRKIKNIDKLIKMLKIL